jgi:pre-rRNA-processing protein TSR4
MAPYDSDSSGGEEEDFTETNVLLGYASADANDEEISRLGGRPVRLGRLILLSLRLQIPGSY